MCLMVCMTRSWRKKQRGLWSRVLMITNLGKMKRVINRRMTLQKRRKEKWEVFPMLLIWMNGRRKIGWRMVKKFLLLQGDIRILKMHWLREDGCGILITTVHVSITNLVFSRRKLILIIYMITRWWIIFRKMELLQLN